MGLEPKDLYKPLGQKGADVANGSLSFPQRNLLEGLSQSVLLALGLAIIAAGGFIALYGEEDGGRAKAIARIELVKPSSPSPAGSPNGIDEATNIIQTPAHKSVLTAVESERAAGVRVIRGGEEAPDSIILQVDPQMSGISLTPAPDKRLVEKSKYGLLPRIGVDGSRAIDVYGRPVMLGPKLGAKSPRVALLVGGVGVSQMTTQIAIDQLAPEISLALAPYGADVGERAERARARGHEIFLHAPMEPFDFAQNNPGPHTLRVSASPEAFGDDLHWLMSRFTGYVGVVNFLGARLLANDGAATALLRELSGRGVGFFDDASTPQSISADVAAKITAPALRADIAIDADPRPEAIETALIRLESIAREKGRAIGFASATPISLDRVNRFARALERRGVALVPVSALYGDTAPSTQASGAK